MSEYSRFVLPQRMLGGKRSALGVGHRPPPLALPSTSSSLPGLSGWLHVDLFNPTPRVGSCPVQIPGRRG